jgi:hypothetical protein
MFGRYVLRPEPVDAHAMNYRKLLDLIYPNSTKSQAINPGSFDLSCTIHRYDHIKQCTKRYTKIQKPIVMLLVFAFQGHHPQPPASSRPTTGIVRELAGFSAYGMLDGSDESARFHD